MLAKPTQPNIHTTNWETYLFCCCWCWCWCCCCWCFCCWLYVKNEDIQSFCVFSLNYFWSYKIDSNETVVHIVQLVGEIIANRTIIPITCTERFAFQMKNNKIDETFSKIYACRMKTMVKLQMIRSFSFNRFQFACRLISVALHLCFFVCYFDGVQFSIWYLCDRHRIVLILF